MKLKKVILGLALLAFCTVPSVCMAENGPDSALRSMVAQYKSKNYLGCLQSSEKILQKNPSDIYAYYYQGLVYSQLGKKDKAIEAFEKVVSLNGNPTIVKYASKGKACLTSEEDCAKFSDEGDDLDKFIKSNKFYDTPVQSEVNKKKLDRIRQNINEELGGKKSEMPTNDEIANAVKTLAKVGFNPLNNMGSNMYQNPELMQMNMLLGSNDSQYNGMNNMLPYLLMGQNQNVNSKMSPELIQTMMMSNMQMY